MTKVRSSRCVNNRWSPPPDGLHRLLLFARYSLFAGLLTLLWLGTLSAQNVGKIAGTVAEAKTGDPLPGTNVMIVGTTMGAASDMNGEYYILNVPPGRYELRSSIIGFEAMKVVEVIVNVGRTTNIDFKLAEAVLEMGEVVVQAVRPEVERDKTSTSEIVRFDEVQSLPGIRDISDVVALAADVIEGHFRGGREGEEYYLLQGMVIVNPLDRSSAFLPIMSGVEEVEVITSGFGAQYGNAQSGVVNISMKEGDRQVWRTRLESRLQAPARKHFGPSVFDPNANEYIKLLLNSEVWLSGDPNMVEAGSFETHGTGNANTVFAVHHYGNVVVTGGNFSVSRGSQGNGSGSTRWYLHEGNFSISNATTQNSNATNARFVFDKADVQTLALSSVTYGGGGLAIEIAGGTTLDFGVSELGGNGLFILNEGATLATAHEGGIAGAVQSTGSVTFNDGANYIFNGTAAQVTSARMPATDGLAINNAAGVVLSQATTINGVLRLMAGEFDNTIPFTLGPNGSISYEGGRLKFTTAVESREQNIPESFFVEQNYPNPFNPSTTISFGLPSASHVTVKVFNMLGQEVATLFEGRKDAGVHNLHLDATNLSAGVYLYRIQAEDVVSVKRMVLAIKVQSRKSEVRGTVHLDSMSYL